MKTTIIGVILIMMASGYKAQYICNVANYQNNTTSNVNCKLEYLADKKIMVLEQGESISICSEISLNSLPPTTEPLTEIDLNLKSGSYTFRVSDSLELPMSNYIYIEDQCNGAAFKIEYGNSYSFVVKRAIPQRFKLYIAKASSASISTKSKN